VGNLSVSLTVLKGVMPRTMPAPQWFFRFMYDRESAAWERGRDLPHQRELVERTVDELASVLVPPGPVADLGCGPGAHALALARRGYDVVGLDGSPRMVERARARAAYARVDATFEVCDVTLPLRFADGWFGGVLAILVLQHLPRPEAFIAEIRRCLRPGGYLLITAPARDSTSGGAQNLYWRPVPLDSKCVRGGGLGVEEAHSHSALDGWARHGRRRTVTPSWLTSW
jgi:SAM-dependent methyltransferase